MRWGKQGLVDRRRAIHNRTASRWRPARTATRCVEVKGTSETPMLWKIHAENPTVLLTQIPLHVT